MKNALKTVQNRAAEALAAAALSKKYLICYYFLINSAFTGFLAFLRSLPTVVLC